MIVITPSNGDCNPKKAIDQKELRTSWMANTTKELCACLWVLRFFNTRYNEIPIKVYNRVQTGAKAQLGGLKKGFSKLAYQVGMLGDVNTAPIKPASWHTIMLNSILPISAGFFILQLG